MQPCMHACMHACIESHACLCLGLYTYTKVHIYMCIHIYRERERIGFGVFYRGCSGAVYGGVALHDQRTHYSGRQTPQASRRALWFRTLGPAPFKA